MKTKSFITLSLLIGSCMIASAEDQTPRKQRSGPPPELIKEFDKDGDGKLSDDEKSAMRDAMKSRLKERHKEVMERFDADKDGKLSPEEREKARAAHKAKMLEKFDKDGDGNLSEEERAAMPKRPRHHAGKRGGKGPKGDNAPSDQKDPVTEEEL